MQFWKGQRVLFGGLRGTVYQDQGLDTTVKITLDKTKNVIRSVYPRKLALLDRAGEAAYEQFVQREWLP